MSISNYNKQQQSALTNTIISYIWLVIIIIVKLPTEFYNLFALEKLIIIDYKFLTIKIVTTTDLNPVVMKQHVLNTLSKHIHNRYADSDIIIIMYCKYIK